VMFSPGEPCSDDPNLLLLQDDYVAAELAATCKTPPVVPSARGTLTWSDGTQSKYSISLGNAKVIRLDGHAVAVQSGKIDCDAPHYPGAKITRLGLRKADPIACLTGGAVSRTIGFHLVALVR
ncbi:hypothetical protein, partial [Streptomyces violascens]